MFTDSLVVRQTNPTRVQLSKKTYEAQL